MWDGDLTGEVVDGRYALGNLYGSGGMAEVYRAFDTKLDRKVAIKLFVGPASHEDRIRLHREAQVLAELHCPGVVTVYDTGSYRGRPFYVMQPVEGGTLRRRMREPLLPEVVAGIGAQVADILAHVHRHGVVHRDVKPSNILLEPDERRVYLADFGLALQAQVTRVTRTGVLVGTAGYLAPEQVRGAEVGPPADVYALGLVLLECLTGRPEYPGGDTEAALARLYREPRVPPHLPAGWGEVLAAMTTTLPSKRPTAAECAALLAPLGPADLDAPPITAPPAAPVVAPSDDDTPDVADNAPGIPPPPCPTPSRARAVLVLGCAAAVLGVIAVLAAVNLTESPPDLEQRPAATPTPRTVVVTQSPSTVTVVREPERQTTAPPPRPVPVEVGGGTDAVTTTGDTGETTEPRPTRASPEHGPEHPNRGQGHGKPTRSTAADVLDLPQLDPPGRG
ncbi:serine/threonine-protein kinase [Saccharothrix obliqua]|uniref:serine/threonine-protein kinase n=1 Tax=Saccharothrix obliqua TaxID=2861747 RepID=UPI001C5D09B3|nr:serine/threonine-protein kinase [Saccharothrix obliqua]MBW4721222.1 serine/threonine protein kinase [Saccharothrix obliqua]